MSTTTFRHPQLPPPLPVDDADRELGTVVADVVDALGETFQTRLQLVEEKIFTRARVAGLQGLGALAVSMFVLAAWVCGAIALGLLLRAPLGGAGALGVLAAIHLVAAGLVAVAVGVIARRRQS